METNGCKKQPDQVRCRKIENVIFVVRREVDMLTKIERRVGETETEMRVSAGLSRMLKSPVMMVWLQQIRQKN